MSLNRRNFLKAAGGLAALTIVPRRVLGGNRFIAPSDQLTKGIIGVGSMGRGHYKYAGARLVAVCDVDKLHLEAAVIAAPDKGESCENVKVLVHESNVDVGLVILIPHWHGIMAAEAARAGKDIWCEKPMTRTIGEGKKVMEAVKRNGRIY